MSSAASAERLHISYLFVHFHRASYGVQNALKRCNANKRTV